MHHFKYVSYYLELSVPLYQFLVLLSELTLLIVIDITEKVFLYISRHFVTFPYLFFFMISVGLTFMKVGILQCSVCI